MTIRRRIGLILVGIGCAVLVVLIVLVPTLLNADRYRTKVVSYLEKVTEFLKPTLRRPVRHAEFWPTSRVNECFCEILSPAIGVVSG